MLSLGDIPPEVLDQILSLVLKETPGMAAAYATVSRDWQSYMEMQCFRSLRLDQNRIKAARKLLTTPRRGYVRHICMDVILPKYPASPSLCSPETAAEQASNNQIFTDAIVSLFEMLASWNLSAAEAGAQAKIALVLRAYSKTDLQSKKPRAQRLYINDYTSHRWKESCLEFLHNAFELPVIPIISRFSSGQSGLARVLSPKACCDITTRFPNLSSLAWVLRDWEMHGIARRREMRQQLAAGIASLPGSVRGFCLEYRSDAYKHADDQAWNPPNLCPDGSALDPLSLAIFRLSQQLESLSIPYGPIGSEAFWPSILQPSGPPPDNSIRFPRLRKVTIDADIVSPSGEWLLQKRRGGSFRDVVVPGQINAYALAMARAAAHMPSLEELSLSWKTRASIVYEVSYEGPKAILTVSGVSPFDLSDEVRGAWGETTRARIGDGGTTEVRYTKKEQMSLNYDNDQVYSLHGNDDVVAWEGLTAEEEALFEGFTYRHPREFLNHNT